MPQKMIWIKKENGTTSDSTNILNQDDGDCDEEKQERLNEELEDYYKNDINRPLSPKSASIDDLVEDDIDVEFEKNSGFYDSQSSTSSRQSESTLLECQTGEKCRSFECPWSHPKSRPRKCKQAELCETIDCPFLHPDTHVKRCPQAAKCANYFCDMSHPISRPRLCPRHVKCMDEMCLLLHPATCESGYRCQEYTCKLKHPPGRIKLCSEFCTNCECEFLHPSNWDPLASGVDDYTERNLRTQAERDAFRIKNNLPILKAKDEIIDRLKKEKILVVTAATGSGKTTQLPQYAAEAFPGLVICTQPRVLAAMTLAQRIASEFDNASVGESVGYKVSGGKEVKGRKILLMTDGALVQMAQKDPMLKDVRVLIIDEAHERCLNTDIVIGIAKLIRKQRPSFFHVIIASATINPKPFLAFFFEYNPFCKELNVDGRVFEIEDIEDPMDFSKGFDRLIPKVVEILKKYPIGNCLVFLPGSSEIDAALKKFVDVAEENWVSFPLYGSLPPEEQAVVMSFDDQNGTLRMIVFCTNIAETSLTVPNIRVVIDTGLAKEARYDPIRRITVIEQVLVSRSSMNQRRGRAGRTAKGVAIRLYKSSDKMRPNIEPEIMRASLDLVVLQLKILKYDPMNFPFIDRPRADFVENSIKLLVELECLENTPEHKITQRGKLFAELPFDPRMSNFVMTAHEKFNQAEMCIIIAAILTAPVNIAFCLFF